MTETQRLRGRPVTHEEAQLAAQRLINSHFHQNLRDAPRAPGVGTVGTIETGHISIPVRAEDDDVTIIDYIAEQRALNRQIIQVARVEVTPGKFELLTFIGQPAGQEWGPAEFGLIVCDIVRHIANAFKVPDKKVWYWVEKERQHPTTPISQVSSS